jgi:uncharacterized protein YjeT (DUF2065 family)
MFSMSSNLSLFLSALGLALVLESLPWLAAPDRWRASLRELLALPSGTLRAAALVLLGAGLGLVALSR